MTTQIEKSHSWSPRLAYAVGLLATDGYLSVSGRHIVLTSKDKQLLKTFLECIDSTHTKIGTNNNGRGRGYFRVQVGNKSLYKWLEKIGLTSNKTFSLGELSVPSKYFADFARGHLDGDGSITTYLDHYNTYKHPKYVYRRLWVRFLSASKNHIEWLQSRNSTILGVEGRIHERLPKDKNRKPIYILKYGKKESIKLLSQIYYDAQVPCLYRKKRVAEPFID